ncbi:MAG: molybdopterin cofactor-binding domain-containing protein [Myxococcota bacterium]
MIASSRRMFLRSASVGGALCVGAGFLPGCGGPSVRVEHARNTGELIANLFVTVLLNGRALLTVPKTEMGQGVSTGYVTMAAEELELEPSKIDHVFADADPRYRQSNPAGAPLFALQRTGGSTSTIEGYEIIRTAAAAAKEMLIAAAAERWGVSSASCEARDGEVLHATSGRRANYGELTRSAAERSVPSDPRLKPPEEFRYIGQPRRRVDTGEKVNGEAIYASDVSVEGMVEAVVIHPPRYGARAESVDAGEAQRMAGVRSIFAFEHGVAVVADKRWQALRAARQVRVEWGSSRLDGLHGSELVAAAVAHEGTGRRLRDDGDVDDALEDGEADALRATYTFPYLGHATMEPMSCVASVTDDRAELWSGTQSPTVAQESLADALDLSTDDVVVHTLLAGGGFGRRGVSDFAVEAGLISRRVGKPVRLLWSREDDLRRAYYRPAAVCKLRGAVKNGRATALGVHALSQPIMNHHQTMMYGALPSGFGSAIRRIISGANLAGFQSGTLPDLFGLEGVHDLPYQIDNLRAEFTPLQTALPVGFWRSVGHSYNPFAVESFVDELAVSANADPYRFRRALLPDGSRAQRVLDTVAEMSRWSEPAGEGFAKGIARHTSFGAEVAQVAEVGVVEGRIRVRRVFCVVDCGIAINPDVVEAQMEGAIIFGLSATLDQELTIEDGEVQQGNFDDFPILRMHECPDIEVRILQSGGEPSGVGEPGLPPIGPAVANALYRATNTRLRDLPLQRAWNERSRS